MKAQFLKESLLPIKTILTQTLRGLSNAKFQVLPQASFVFPYFCLSLLFEAQEHSKGGLAHALRHQDDVVPWFILEKQQVHFHNLAKASAAPPWIMDLRETAGKNILCS